jgi:MraZ protein
LGRSFRGESVHKVDSKGRVSIPASFRRVLEEGDSDFPAHPNPQFVIVYGVMQGECLEGYTMAGMEKLDARIAELPPYSPERDELELMFNTKSLHVTLDDTGRMVLPARLREMAGIGEDAIFAGMNEKFQIWDPKSYEARQRGMEARIAERSGNGGPLAFLGRTTQAG